MAASPLLFLQTVFSGLLHWSRRGIFVWLRICRIAKYARQLISEVYALFGEVFHGIILHVPLSLHFELLVASSFNRWSSGWTPCAYRTLLGRVDSETDRVPFGSIKWQFAKRFAHIERIFHLIAVSMMLRRTANSYIYRFIYLSAIYLSIFLILKFPFIYLSTCLLPICISIYVSIYLYCIPHEESKLHASSDPNCIHHVLSGRCNLFIYLRMYLSTYVCSLSIYLPTYVSTYASISIYLSLYLDKAIYLRTYFSP